MITCPYEIGGKSLREPPFTPLPDELGIIYHIIKVIGSIEAWIYCSLLKRSQIPCCFYKTMLSIEMPYMEDEQLYSSMKTVLIRCDHGLKRSFCYP
jgi:hypothetical protein